MPAEDWIAWMLGVCPCSSCECRVAASIPFAMSAAWVSVSSRCDNNFLWIDSFFNPHTRWSLRASLRNSPKEQWVASWCSSARNSEIVSSGPWARRWKWKCSAITILLGSKCFLSSEHSTSYPLSDGFAGATKLRRTAYVLLPMTLKKTETFYAFAISLAVKKEKFNTLQIRLNCLFH